ncbi:MAG: phage major capsid protein [Pseudomonadota bacterium]
MGMTEFEQTASVSPEAKSAAQEFLSNFKAFKDDVSKRMSDMTTRIERLDRKSTDARRPVLETAATERQPHQKAIGAYIRKGDEEPMKSLGLDLKGVTTMAADGGFLVDPKTAEMVEHVLRSGASIRGISRVVQVEASAYDVLVDRGDVGAGWISETSATGIEADTTAIERITIPLHELSAAPTASQRILDDAAFNVEEWLAERVSDKFLRAESAAFVSGDGINKPVGFLTKPMVAESAWTWGNIGYVVTGTSGGFDPNDPADALVELIYTLGAEYRSSGAFVMNSKTAGEVRKMKDSQGRFLWAESLTNEQPARLMGYPVQIVEDMPDIGADAHAIAFGDFSHGYTIAERPDIRLLRDPFTARPNVMFFATKRVGGDVTDFAAIKTLKFGAS